MAQFGRYTKTASGAYRSMDTGRFISKAEVASLNRIARAYGSLSQGLNKGLLAAAESISQRHGIAYDEVVSRLETWRRDVADSLAKGDDAPAIPSP